MYLFEKYSLLLLRFIVAVLVFVLVGVMALIVMESNNALAQSSLPPQTMAPFGGMVTDVFYCGCSGNYRLTVSPPVGGVFMYQPGATIVYEYRMIPVTGVWLLGLLTSPVACIVPSGKGCSTIGSYPMIYMTGTSM